MGDKETSTGAEDAREKPKKVTEGKSKVVVP